MDNKLLSAKKTKVHGMKSRRWTTQDKIQQYRGLAVLYARDKKIVERDINSTRRRLHKEIRSLRQKIKDQRFELKNALVGDKQRLRNTLEEHRYLQLAYQNLPPTRVIDALYQENFNKRKHQDRVQYETKLKTQKLISLKLEYAELEDRIKYESKEKIPEEEQAQIITARVQDAILKKEAAISVRDTYSKIINILRKDATFFDAVLAAIQIDGYYQGKCIYRVTEMGQLATEYLDDRNVEYRILEKQIKKSMKDRENSLSNVQSKLEELNNNVKYLIKQDLDTISDLDEKSLYNYKTSEYTLTADIDKMEEIFIKIKDATMVTKIEQIFPRLEDQFRQKCRLEQLLENNLLAKEELLKKLRHAEELNTSLNFTMVDSTSIYMEEKKRLSLVIEATTAETEKTAEIIEHRGTLIIDVRNSLDTILEILRNVSLEKPSEKSRTKSKGTRKSRVSAHREELVEKLTHETNPMKIIETITKKVQLLVNAAGGIELEGDDMEEAGKKFSTFVQDMTPTDDIIKVDKQEESLIGDDAYFEDPTIPSRIEIKARSAKIVAKYATDELEDITAFSKKK